MQFLYRNNINKVGENNFSPDKYVIFQQITPNFGIKIERERERERESKLTAQSGNVLILALLIIAGIIGSGFIAYRVYNSRSVISPVPTNQPTTTPTPTLEIKPEVSQHLNVDLSSYEKRLSQLEQNYFSFANSSFPITSSFTDINLLRNSSFEQEQGSNQPRYWTYMFDSTTSNTFRSAEGIHSGSYGLKFVGGKGAGSGLNLGISQPDTKTVPVRTYTLSAFIKLINISSVTIRLGFWDEQNNQYGEIKSFDYSQNFDWKRISITVTTPGLITDSKNYYPIIEVRGLKDGSVYLDDVQLEEGNALTIYNTAAAYSNSAFSSLGGGSILGGLDGNLYPATNGIGGLGTSSNSWNSLYLSSASIDKDGNLTVNGSSTVKGDETVNGLSTIKGNTTLGDSSSDTITTNGRFNSSLIPSATTTYDLGSSSLYWNNLYAKTLNISGGQSIGGDISVTGALGVTGVTTLSNLSTGIVQTNSSGLLSSNLGTANYIPKWNTTGFSTTSTIFDNGNVGIGTTGPGAKLDVNGNALIQGMSIGTGEGTGIQNTGIGVSSLAANTTGTKNVFLGYLAGSSNTEGYQSVGVGWESLKLNTTGYNNTGLGVAALLSNTIGFSNTAIGKSTLHNNQDGYFNTAIGSDSQLYAVSALYNTSVGAESMGSGIVTGSGNVAVGYNTLNELTGGAGNIAVGNAALAALQTGNFNTAIGGQSMSIANGATANTAMGYAALLALTYGARNTAVGQGALVSTTTQNGNVALGYYAGAYEMGSNSFYVNNQDRTNTAGDKTKSLIYGVFDADPANQKLTINGNVGIGTTNPGSYKTYINGSLAVNSDTADKTGSTSWGTISDIRLKDIQGNYTLGLKEIMQLNAIKFNYKADNPLGLDSTKTYEGFSAQDVQKIIPEAISMRSDGYLRLNADPIMWAILNGIKEQQLQIATLSGQLISLNNNVIPTEVEGSLSAVETTQNTRLQTIEAFFEGIITTFKKAVTFLSDVTFGGRVTFQDKDMAGYAKIKLGAKEVKITYEKPYEIQPVVNATAKKENVTFTISDESKEGFTIKLISAALEDINFSWIAIMVKDTKTYESSDSVPSPTPTIQSSIPIETTTPSVVPTVTPTNEPTSTPSPTLLPTIIPSLTPSIEASPSVTP